MDSNMLRPGRIVLILLVGLSACTDTAGPREYRKPGITILSGAAGSDTVNALLRESLQVLVRGPNGHPLTHAQIVFTGDALFVAEGARPTYKLSTTTDEAGYASTRVILPPRAGEVAIEIKSFKGLGWGEVVEYRDTVVYTVLPGAPAGAMVFPADTAVLPGATYALTLRATDQHGNLRSEVLTDVAYRALSPAVSVGSDGAVSALAVGRGIIELRSGTIEKTAFVAVMPEAVLSAAIAGDIHVVDLVGNSDVFAPGVEKQSLQHAWHPDGTQIVTRGLQLIDAAGTTRRLETPFGDRAQRPQFSSDGEWIYFEVFDDSTHQNSIWRISADGSRVDSITEGMGPSPSPDGTRIAYITRLGDIAVHDLAHESTDTLSGEWATVRVRWSPDGEWLAAVGGPWYLCERFGPARYGVDLVRPDGTERRPLPLQSSGPVSWSPDSRWMVVDAACPDSRFLIARIADGEVLPLNESSWDYAEPEWRP